MRGFQTTHDWAGDRPLSCTVVEAVAAASGRDPTEVGQLSTAVDPDSLDALFRPLDGPPPRNGSGRIEFSYDGYRVTVAASGEVSVAPAVDEPDGVTTRAAFEDELGRLVREAEANGVGVEGGWASGDGSREWGIEIYKVRRSGRVFRPR